MQESNPEREVDPARGAEAERELEHTADELEERLERLEDDLDDARSEHEERKKDAEGREGTSI